MDDVCECADHTDEIILVAGELACHPHCDRTDPYEERADNSSACKCIDDYEYGINDPTTCFKECDSHLIRDSTDDSC